MHKIATTVATAAFLLSFMLASPAGLSNILLTSSGYTQDFNTLVSSGTSSSLPTGWYLSESLTNANTMYTAGTGSSNTGDTYSFGSSGSGERALGGLQSNNLNPIFGAAIQNAGGSDILSLSFSYRGEQWRLGAINRTDRLDFQISFDATSLTTGTWSDYDALDFTAPTTTGTTGALLGNSNATNLSHSFATLIANNQTFWIRWTDFNASGSDDGLAVDDFGIQATFRPLVPEPGSFLVWVTLAALGLTTSRRRSARSQG